MRGNLLVLILGLALSSASFACDEDHETNHGASHGKHHHGLGTATADSSKKASAGDEDEHHVSINTEGETLTGHVSMHVSGMMCTSCRAKLETAIKKLPEVESVSANLKEKSMSLTMKSPLARIKLSQALTKVGFNLQ
jgi:copper chaperone CopZ